MINGLNLEALAEFKDSVANNAKNGMYSGGVKATWIVGTKVAVKTNDLTLGDEIIPHDFSFDVDEPKQLLGTNSEPTPQDYVLGGLSGCMMVTFVAMCSIKNIELKSVLLEIKSSLDLQGFLGVNESSPIGFDTIHYTFIVKGNGTDAQFKEAAEEVKKFSPNYATMASQVKMVEALNVL